MTREEAKNKYNKSQRAFERDDTNFINALEALGLIKFEEEKQLSLDSILCINSVNIRDLAVYSRFEDICNAVEVHGYKIVKA